MRIQPIFGTMQRDGRNKNGQMMFKCRRDGCVYRSTWKHQMHGHKKLEPEDEDKAGDEAKKISEEVNVEE